MTIDEIEKLAREVADAAVDWHAERLARALLAMLPVVRAVESLCGPYGLDNPPPVLARAIDKMREALK